MREVLYIQQFKKVTTNLKWSAVISFFFVLPLAAINFWFNGPGRQSAIDAAPLFGLLWILPVIFIAVLAPTMRSFRANEKTSKGTFSILLTIIFLAVVASLWGWLVIDQAPCFIGVPNCD